jgi:hypothetical protein
VVAAGVASPPATLAGLPPPHATVLTATMVAVTMDAMTSLRIVIS